MKFFSYLNDIKIRINNINSFILNSQNYKDIYNPFLFTENKPKTYVWIEKDN